MLGRGVRTISLWNVIRRKLNNTDDEPADGSQKYGPGKNSEDKTVLIKVLMRKQRETDSDVMINTLLSGVTHRLEALGQIT